MPSLRAMDGISAAASLIAIGQAIAVLPKVVQALQSVIKFKAEVAYLINEVLQLPRFCLVKILLDVSGSMLIHRYLAAGVSQSLRI